MTSKGATVENPSPGYAYPGGYPYYGVYPYGYGGFIGTGPFFFFGHDGFHHGGFHGGGFHGGGFHGGGGFHH
jgi:hypothetical protein